MKGFKEVNIREIKKSVQEMISDDWMLITAGDESGWNTMTASWGGLGEIWGKDAAFAFIRPQRYTLGFVEKSGLFTLSFFGGKYKDEMKICGSKSGRDIDKSAETGLKPVFIDSTTGIEQAEVIMVCRTMAVQQIDPEGFIDPSVMKWYPENDFHKVFIGAIEKVYVKE
mgnify:CR=1 FL=1